VRRGVKVDVVTDQTSAHDPLNGYVPQGLTLAEAAELRRRDPEEYVRRSTATMVVHVDAMLALQRAGAVTFDYGNNIRRFAFDAGCADAFLIQVLCRSTFGRCSAPGRGRSAGLRFPATRRH